MTEQKVAIVTGGAGGIGRAIVTRLSSEGFFPVILDIDRASPGRMDGRESYHCDVTSSLQVNSTLKKIKRKHGRIDMLICTAGHIAPGLFCNVSDDSIRKTMEVNFFGTMNCIRAAIPSLQESAGHIVIVSSLAGIVPAPHHGAYCASKFALRGMAMTLALELKEMGIRVSNVMPDSILTPMLVQSAIQDGSPLAFLKDPGTPEMVADAVAATIRRPVLERSVPRFSGFQARLASLFPETIPYIWPRMEEKGRRRLEKIRLGLDPVFGPLSPLRSLKRAKS